MSTVSLEALTKAIYGQESSHGKADTSKENYAQARGPMQVTKPTFEGMKRNGSIPANYDHANPEHTMEAGKVLLGDLFNKFNGDPRKTAAAYYAGEKAIRADGSIKDFRDLKNSKAPTTLQYVSQVMGRMGETGEQPTAPATVTTSWNTPMPGKRTTTAKAASEAASPTALPLPKPAEPLVQTQAREQADAEAEAKKVEDTTFLDVARAQFASTLPGWVMRDVSMRDFLETNKPVPGYRIDMDDLAGKTQEEQDFLMRASSPSHADRIKFEIDYQREQDEIGSRLGTGAAIAGAIIAGAPTDYLMGAGIMRGMYMFGKGSLQLAGAGRKLAAYQSSLVENLGGAGAAAVLQDAVDPYFSVADYAMFAGGGLMGAALNAPSVWGAADRAAAMASAKTLEDGGRRALAENVADAVESMPHTTDPAEIRNAISKLEAQKAKDALSDVVPDDRRLIPESDDLRYDVPETPKSASSMTIKDPVAEFGPTVKPLYDDPDMLKRRAYMAETDPEWKDHIATITGKEFDFQSAGKLKDRVTLTEGAKSSVSLVAAVDAVQGLANKFLKGKVVVGNAVKNTKANGEIVSAGDVHFIGLVPKDGSPTSMLRTAVHEVGHAVVHENLRYAPRALLTRMQQDHGLSLLALKGGDAAEFANRRFSVTDSSRDAGMDDLLKNKEYVANFDEYAAEQYVKFVEKAVRDDADVGLSQRVVKMVRDAVQAALDFFREAKRKDMIDPDESFAEFFQGIMNKTIKQEEEIAAAAEEFLAPDLIANFSKPLNDPIAKDIGLDMAPNRSPQQQAEVAAILGIHKKAAEMAPRVDEKRLSKLLDLSPFKWAQSTTNTMLRSKNPVMRLFAAELLESPSGAAGRRSNASIGKFMEEQRILGNVSNEVQNAFAGYRNDLNGSVIEDTFGGKVWEKFSKDVATEIEMRRLGKTSETHPSVKVAADSLEAAYERARVAQVDTKTIGWASLPETSKGYMPHRVSAAKFSSLNAEQRRVMHKALAKQFEGIEGFDDEFSAELASKYMDRVHQRVHGGYDAPVGRHSVGAADVVEEALTSMGLARAQVLAMMKKYMAGRPGHTKKRLDLDLMAEYPLEDGSVFKLMDAFETDPFLLLRSQASRVSGEVALARHGIMGKPGLDLMRRAAQFGKDGQRATPAEMEALDQVAAEFLGAPFGTQNKSIDRLMQVNSLTKLGGMGFTQMGEAVNAIFHVGAGRTLNSIAGYRRLRSELIDMAAGKEVNNPIIGSLEHFGTDFGTSNYKTVFPFENPSAQFEVYGKDTPLAMDRALRSGLNIQAKLSMWRALHAVQRRGMAEQIVRKAADFIKKGGDDVALKDMGIDGDMLARLRKDIDNIAEFDGDTLTNFDISKATDKEAAYSFIQAVQRGTSQIIQEAFIGERGKWVHDGWMRLMTQFRTFSITSIEKQWGRQVGNHGHYKALGMMIGSMSVAAPIYMARTYAASIGREDQAEYLDKQLSPAQIARASLNYIAMSGLAGDFLDATSAVTGVGEVTGGRTGAASGFVGNVVAPAAGAVDDLWRAVQNNKEGTDPHELIKNLPFSRLPYIIPGINALGD